MRDTKATEEWVKAGDQIAQLRARQNLHAFIDENPSIAWHPDHWPLEEVADWCGLGELTLGDLRMLAMLVTKDPEDAA